MCESFLNEQRSDKTFKSRNFAIVCKLSLLTGKCENLFAGLRFLEYINDRRTCKEFDMLIYFKKTYMYDYKI